MTLSEFRENYPTSTLTLSTGKPFTYRYARNPEARATLVLLTGGIGLSDLFYLHFIRFSRDFSVLTFDYQLPFGDNREFAEAVAELLHHLGEKVWLVGQSLGGIVAQIIAAEHPEVVDGLVLSNTCSLSAGMNESAMNHVSGMIRGTRKSKCLLRLIPFGLYKRLVKRVVMTKKTGSFTQEEKDLMESLCDAMLEQLTKPYELHMLDFLMDAQHHMGMTPDQFIPWDDRVLLILSEDDDTFNADAKEALVEIMPHPTVVTKLTGGHLALLIRLDAYADLVTDYIRKRT